MSIVGSIVAGESATPAGQQAVLNVMQNRAAVNFDGYGTTIQAQATAPLQFSAYPNNLGASSSSTENMVSAANAGTLGNIVPNSLNYANPSIMSQSAQPNSWVWGAQASGQGVQIGGNTFWANSSGGSPGYDPSQLGSGSTIAAGPVDNSQGSTPASGSSDPLGSGVTMNPDQTIPATTASPTAATTGATTAQPSTSPLASDVGAGTPLTQGLQQGTITAIQGWITNIESATGGAFSGAVKAAETAVGTYFGSIQNWFVRAFLIIVGIVILGVALIALMWDHGGKETAQQFAAVART